MESDLIGMAASNTKTSPMQLGCAPRGDKVMRCLRGYSQKSSLPGSSAKISLHKEIHETNFENVKNQYITKGCIYQ